MIRRGKKNHPRMLANVLKAIADMKDNRGSSIRKIVEQVASNNVPNKAVNKPRNVTMQVRRALRHGINTGLLVQHGGKYRLGLDESDAFPVKEIRRRRKKGGKKGRGKRRRRSGRKRRVRRRSSRASSGSLSDSEASPVSEETSYTSMDSEDAATKRPSRKSKRSAPKPDRSSSRKKKRVAEEETNKDGLDNYDNQVTNTQPECDNPDCLCNIKQENEDPPERGLDDQGFNGGYIN